VVADWRERIGADVARAAEETNAHRHIGILATDDSQLFTLQKVLAAQQPDFVSRVHMSTKLQTNWYFVFVLNADDRFDPVLLMTVSTAARVVVYFDSGEKADLFRQRQQHCSTIAAKLLTAAKRTNKKQ